MCSLAQVGLWMRSRHSICYAYEFKRHHQHVICIQLHFTYQMKLTIALNSILWNRNWNGNQSVIQKIEWILSCFLFHLFGGFFVIAFRNQWSALFLLPLSLLKSFNMTHSECSQFETSMRKAENIYRWIMDHSALHHRIRAVFCCSPFYFLYCYWFNGFTHACQILECGDFIG